MLTSTLHSSTKVKYQSKNAPTCDPKWLVISDEDDAATFYCGLNQAVRTLEGSIQEAVDVILNAQLGTGLVVLSQCQETHEQYII